MAYFVNRRRGVALVLGAAFRAQDAARAASSVVLAVPRTRYAELGWKLVLALSIASLQVARYPMQSILSTKVVK